MADTCCAGSGSCTCDRSNTLAALTVALATYEGLIASLRQELLASITLVSAHGLRIATLEAKAQADLADLDRIRSECSTLRTGWAEFERVGIAQEQVISRLRSQVAALHALRTDGQEQAP